MGPPLKRTHVKGGSAPPSVDAPGAAVEQLSAGDLSAGFKGFLDGVFIWLACGGEGVPLGIEGLFVVDHDR